MKTILSLFPGLMSGRRLADEGELQQLLQLLFSTGTIIGSGAPNTAPVLNAAINLVTGTGQHVVLPAALAGRQVILVNKTNSNLIVHAQTVNTLNDNQPDAIDGGPLGDVPFETSSIFVSYLTGQWTNMSTVVPVPP